MTETTKKILEAAFLADQTATEEERTAFKQLVNGGRGDKKTMIPTRQACEMLVQCLLNPFHVIMAYENINYAQL